MKILSLEQIQTRLDDRFRLLTGTRSAVARHQTLHAVIQWSWDQLTSGEQRLLRSLSVFAGGCTLEAAAAVAGDDADEFEVMDLLARLVDKSLVRVDGEGSGDPRYGLLETVRQFGLERLEAEGAAGRAQARHADFYRALSERAYAERHTRETFWAEILEREHDNLRLALAHARGVPERSLELAGALAWFWQARSHLHALSALPAASPVRTEAEQLLAVN